MTRMGDWVERALCREFEADLWFPDLGGSPERARALCVTCPVQMECLEYSLRHPGLLGVWGGTTNNERQELHRRRRAS